MKKVVVITGGAKGIGKSICEKFAKKEFDVVIVDFDEAGALETKKEIETLGINAHVVKCDISSEDNVKEVRKLVEKEYGYLTALVNNAAVAITMPGKDLDSEKFKKMIDINTMGTFYMIKQLLDLLLKSKEKGQVPSVVNVASTGAFTGGGGSLGYPTSKGGTISMTKAFARHFGDEGLRVNAVAPTLIRTPLMIERYKDDPSKMEEQAKSVPLRRLMEPEEVAEICYFLTKPTYIHGETIIADGGRGLV